MTQRLDYFWNFIFVPPHGHFGTGVGSCAWSVPALSFAGAWPARNTFRSIQCALAQTATPPDAEIPAPEVARRFTTASVLLAASFVATDTPVADGQTVPETLLAMCERAELPMFSTPESAAFVIDVLRAYLSKHFADRTTMHGVFMDILGLGVMITGESGLGKSELGLELISRGNGLVADDAVDLFRINQATIEGRCPELLQNLLEVRGIGLLDIRAIFGETAVRRKMRLKLIVHLVRKETLERDYERLPHEPLMQDVLGVPVRKVVIQVVAGRNIAVLVEAAVRNSILQLRGVDTYQEFIARHQRAMTQK